MTKTPNKDSGTSNDCFVIMPISDTDGYDKGHFKRVYDDIFKIAIDKAGYCPVRADEVLQTNFIHLDILQKLIASPMAVCDVSSRNPNVLFELGLRQAFDKPTVLVQEVGTQKIFDIAPLRFTEYRKELKYREVLEDQINICEAIKATKTATTNGEGINSLINLLSLSSPATLKDITDKDSTKMFQIMMAEINELRTDFRHSLRRMDEKAMFQKDDRHLFSKEMLDLEKYEFEIRDVQEMISKEGPEELIDELINGLRHRLMRQIDFAKSDRTRIMTKEYLMKVEHIKMKWRNNLKK